MNLSKKMIACAAFILALCSTSAVFAQGGGGRMMDTAAMNQRFAKMKTDLNLTQVQADSIKAINTDMMQKGREIREANQGMSRDDMRAKMQPLRDAANTRIQAVLGADLYKKYQDWQEQNRPQGMRGGGGGN
jgi:hypothetical protein